MSKIKEKVERLIEKRHLIPDEFWVRTVRIHNGYPSKETAQEHEAIWFLDRQKPSIIVSYDYDEERLGVTRDGNIIWGFDSGCSCPTPWEGVDYHTAKEWKEFEICTNIESFDSDWKDASETTLNDYLKLIDAAEDNLNPKDALLVTNAEIRRYLIKRVGYENIKDAVNAEILHRDGDNELLRFASGELYVKVKDSSTEREYLLYVEGNHMTCRSAIAWTFGLSEEQYNPIIET